MLNDIMADALRNVDPKRREAEAARWAAERERRDHRVDEADANRTAPSDLPPNETRNQRHAREIGERDARWGAEREAQRAREENRRIERENQQAERLQRAAADRDFDERLTRLNNQVRDIGKATGQITELLDAELKRLQLENLELRTLFHKLERTVVAELPNTPAEPKLRAVR
jgi:hypothetical protein